MKPIKRSKQVLAQIERIDELLERSGVRSFCLRCIRRENPPTGPNGGCCHDPLGRPCELLGPTGCTNKPLACAVYLCGYARAKFPEVAEELRLFYGITQGYRMESLKAEQALVQLGVLK